MRLTRLFVGAAIVAVTITLVVVVFLRQDHPDRSLERVHQSGRLTVGLDPSYPPFESIGGDGIIDGFDVDLARALATRLGVETSLISIDSGGIFDALEVGKFDVIIGGISPDPDQSSRFGFTRPYFDAGLVALVGPADRGKVLGYESGSDADLNRPRLSADLPAFDLRPFDDQERLRAALQARSVRGAILDAVTARRWSQEGPGLTVLPGRLSSVPFVVACRIGDQALFRAVDNALQSLVADGSVRVLEGKWVK
jgi:ABC-type amino acid transport substrate-binding protein